MATSVLDLARANSLCSLQGDMNLRKGDFAQAYMLYWRYAILITERLKKHPEYKTAAGRDAAKPVVASLPGVLDILGHIKPLIDREYQEWQAADAKRRELRAQQRAELEKLRSLGDQQDDYDEPAPLYSSRHEELDVDTHRDLAVELAQREMQRRETEKRANQRDGMSADQERNRRVAGIWDRWTVELAEQQAQEEELFRRQMESTRLQLDYNNDYPAFNRQPKASEDLKPQVQPGHYYYPSISRSEPVQYDFSKSKPRDEVGPRPARPPKEDLISEEAYHSRHTSSPLPPALPAKDAIYTSRQPASVELLQPAPSLPPKIHEAPPEPPVKAQKSFRPAAYLENGEPMRSIILPRQLRHRFLQVASDNTKKGLEMCGMLCGTDVNNVLVVSTLIIPEQKCTSDTCETENESALLEYCMSEDLLMLGWIHTHPTQTCFMSSRDLHTHAGYQIMLPESIAIVCAPTKEPE